MSITTSESYNANQALSSTLNTKIYDIYSSLLNYKKEQTELKNPTIDLASIPSSHKRRLLAYDLLEGYMFNYSRDFRKSPETSDISQNDELREPGDAYWLADKMKNKLLGDTVSVNMPLPYSDNTEKALNKVIKSENFDDNVKNTFKEKINSINRTKDITNVRENYIKDWFNNNNIRNIINKNELKASYKGDCVYFVYWDNIKNTVNLKTYDPANCFPFYYKAGTELTKESGKNEYVIERFYLAWKTADKKIYMEIYELREGINDNRCFRHRGKYNVSSDDINISIDNIGTDSLLSENLNEWEDLEIDFIPFVWIANIPVDGNEPFGLSNFHFQIDLFDSMINNITDIGTNGEYLGGAVLTASGDDIRAVKDSNGEPKAIKIQPRSVYFLGKNGKLELVDTSNMQTSLIKTDELQRKRFLDNVNIPDIIAGQGDVTHNISGVALSILLQPLVEKIMPMRISRLDSYGTMFEYIQKFFKIFGNDYERSIFGIDSLYRTTLKFGDILPQDTKAELEELNLLKGVFSQKTVLEMAQRKGYDIDIDEEIKRLNDETEIDNQQMENAFNRVRQGNETS